MINRVVLVGRLTRDVEVRKTTNGLSVASFTVACDRRQRRDAQNQQSADFISCVAWRQTADFICRFFKKGSSICISGSVQTRTWNDQQNNKRYATEIVADEAYFVDAKADAPVASFGGDAPAFQTQESARFEEVASDDDLPF